VLQPHQILGWAGLRCELRFWVCIVFGLFFNLQENKTVADGRKEEQK